MHEAVRRRLESERAISKFCQLDQAFDIPRDDLNLRGQVTHELYAGNRNRMKVIKCLAVLHVNVAQKIVLRLQEGIIGVLTSEKFLLLK